MPDGFRSIPVTLGSLVLCERCRCPVPRWDRTGHTARHEERDTALAALTDRVARLEQQVTELMARTGAPV